MSCPKFWSVSSIVVMVAFVGGVPLQTTAAPSEKTAAKVEGSPFLSKLRFVPEADIDQTWYTTPVPQRKETTEKVAPKPAFPSVRWPQGGAATHTPENIPMRRTTTLKTPANVGESKVVPKQEKTIADALTKLAGTDRDGGQHRMDHGSCLIAVIFEAIKVPEDTLEKLEKENPDLHGDENEIWQQLLDMMALDFITDDDDDEDDDDEEYDDDYYDDYYDDDDYDYDCDEESECGDDTATATNPFRIIPFPPMMTK